MRKYLIILFFCFFNSYYSNAQILNTITSVYVDGIEISKNNERLLIDVKKQGKKNVFQIQYEKLKIQFSIFNSELSEGDSISIRINSLAKKKEVNIIEGVKSGAMVVTRCIRCKENIPYKSTVVLCRKGCVSGK